MHKPAIPFGIAAIAVIGVLICWISRQGQLITKQQKKIDFLSSKIASNEGSDRVQLMKLDQDCAKQALRVFNEEKANFPKGVGVVSSYTSHYSRKHNKCFVCSQWQGLVGGVPEAGKNLDDAYEHKI